MVACSSIAQDQVSQHPSMERRAPHESPPLDKELLSADIFEGNSVYFQGMTSHPQVYEINVLYKKKKKDLKLGRGWEGWEVDLGIVRGSENNQSTLYVCMKFSKYQ